MIALPATGATAESPAVIEIAAFSRALTGSVPDGWQPLTFKKISRHTTYEVVNDAGTMVVKAFSDASASGLVKSVVIDPNEYPIVRWRWRIERVLERSDVSRKQGDDFPARLYITFEYDPARVGIVRKLTYKTGRALFGDIPIAALNYVWETRTPVGTIVPNAYTDFARMVIVENGSQHVGDWVDEVRNVRDDYARAFGEAPPKINGVAIMTDTDDTQDTATAYYGDIVFEQSP